MTEKAIQKAIVRLLRDEYLAIVVKPDCMVYSGYPDLLVWMPGPRAVVMEVKQPGKRPTLLQQKRLQDFRDRGFEAYVVTSVEDVERVL